MRIDAHVITAPACFTPNKPGFTGIGTKGSSAGLNTTFRGSIIVARARPYIGRYAYVIVGAARFAPDGTFHTGVGTEVADSPGRP